MSIIKKVKQFLGIGTVKVTLQTSGTFSASDLTIPCKAIIEGKSDQILTAIKAELVETWTTGTGDNKKEKKIPMGNITLPGFEIKKGEIKTIEINLPFEYQKSENDTMAEKGGVMGGIGKLSKFASGEKSTFRLTVETEIKGAKISPLDSVEMKRK